MARGLCLGGMQEEAEAGRKCSWRLPPSQPPRLGTRPEAAAAFSCHHPWIENALMAGANRCRAAAAGHPPCVPPTFAAEQQLKATRLVSPPPLLRGSSCRPPALCALHLAYLATSRQLRTPRPVPPPSNTHTPGILGHVQHHHRHVRLLEHPKHLAPLLLAQQPALVDAGCAVGGRDGSKERQGVVGRGRAGSTFEPTTPRVVAAGAQRVPSQWTAANNGLACG